MIFSPLRRLHRLKHPSLQPCAVHALGLSLIRKEAAAGPMPYLAASIRKKHDASPSIFCGLTIEGLASPSLPGGKEFPIYFFTSYHGPFEKSTAFTAPAAFTQYPSPDTTTGRSPPPAPPRCIPPAPGLPESLRRKAGQHRHSNTGSKTAASPARCPG